MSKDAEFFQSVRDSLSGAKKSSRCSDVTKHLKSLGFEVRDGKRGGHKVFTHDELPDFTSSSYNCGHGKNPEIKPAYIAKVVKLLDEYKTELIEYLDKN